MGLPYPRQLERSQEHVAHTLADHVGPTRWMAPFHGPEAGFRNKAKLVVGGVAGAVTLGILDGEGHGVDLRECGLYVPALQAALPALAEFVDAAQLVPYDVPSRRGEVKYLIVTCSPQERLMVRFVARSRRHEELLRARLPHLRTLVPNADVVTLNVHPRHEATLEGDTEMVLSEQTALPMGLGQVTLHLRPNSFFQTNTVVAQGLYAHSTEWVRELQPRSVLDLYCGVGGFALHSATVLDRPSQVGGIELSEQAVRSAELSARELTQRDATHPQVQLRFRCADAATVTHAEADAELVIVNPPRRGIGTQLAGWLEGSGAQTLIYSSCNAASLAQDLSALPSWQVQQARLFDMFPQTTHHEVLVRLGRR